MSTDWLPKTRSLIAGSAIAEELMQFATWLDAAHYTPVTIHGHAFRADRILRRLPRVDANGKRLVTAVRAAFSRERKPMGRRNAYQATRRAYERFLVAHGRLLTPPVHDAFAALRHDYAEYLLEVRGLSPSSRIQHAGTIIDFLQRGLKPAQPLTALSQSDVEHFIVLRSHEVSRHSLQHTVAHVRGFLRYCHDHGLIRSRFEPLDTPRTYRGELLPQALPWPVVRSLLASIDRQSKAGWRDYCILHLISHYGLRPSEVVGLRLDSIDWGALTLRVWQPKTRSLLVLPLAGPTARILKEYLRRDRRRHGSDHPQLFLRARCPSGPLERTAIGDLFAKHVRAAGLDIEGKRVSPASHVRHATAGARGRDQGNRRRSRPSQPRRHLCLSPPGLRHAARSCAPSAADGWPAGDSSCIEPRYRLGMMRSASI